MAPPGSDGESGWQVCYLTHAGPESSNVAVGFAGIKKWHPEHRTIQIGTAFVPEYHGHRLGEEIVAAVGKWGISQPGIQRVICDVPHDHVASAKSLERAGFSNVPTEAGQGFVRFELKKQAD